MKTSSYVLGAVAALALLMSCATLQPVKDTTTLERQLQETNDKIEELSHKLSIVQFMVDDHQKTLKEIEAALEGNAVGAAKEPSAAVQAPPVPQPARSEKRKPVSGESPEQLYKRALSVYKKGSYGKAATIFNAVVETYSTHGLADNALYWTGECFYAQKNYKGAIRTFKKVAEKYPSGSKVPDSLLKIGYSYLALGDRTNAQSFLKKVVKQYPFTPAGSKAGEMLKRIKTK